MTIISKSDVDVFVMSIIERQPLNDYKRAENVNGGVVFRFVDPLEVRNVISYAERYGFIHGSVKIEDDIDPSSFQDKNKVFMSANEIGQYVWCRWFDLRRLHDMKPDIPVLYYAYERPPLCWRVWPDLVKICYAREKIHTCLINIETIGGCHRIETTFFPRLWNASAENTFAASRAIDFSEYRNPNEMYFNIVKLLESGDSL